MFKAAKTQQQGGAVLLRWRRCQQTGYSQPYGNLQSSVGETGGLVRLGAAYVVRWQVVQLYSGGAAGRRWERVVRVLPTTIGE